MNIVELHREIDSINDIVNSPRFEFWQKDQAINYANKNIVKNRYEKAKSEDRSQRTTSLMRLRDELYTIVEKKSSTDISIYTPAYLTGGNGAETTPATWAAVSDGSFNITIDGTLRSITAIDFTGLATMALIANKLQTAIRAITSGLETVIWSTDHFIIASVLTTVSSTITVTSAQGAGTDISGAGASNWMDCNIGSGVVTSAVVSSSALIITNDIITLASLPERYVYLLAVEYIVNNLQRDFAGFVTYIELPVLQKNPFRRPSKVYPYKFYYFLSSAGIELKYGKISADTVTEAHIYYLANPIDVDYGTTITSSSDVQVSDTPAIIQADGTVYATVTYYEGDEVTILSGTRLTSGSASINFVNTDLPEILHTEIAQEAAKFLELKVKDFDKWRAMEEKEMIDKR